MGGYGSDRRGRQSEMFAFFFANIALASPGRDLYES